MIRRVILIGACALALGGCTTLSAIGSKIPFIKAKNTTVATQGERVSVIAFDDKVSVNDTLKGKDFDLPPPAAQQDWPVPGGTTEQSVEHVDAAPAFEIDWKRGFGAKSNRARHVTAPPIEMGGKIFVMDGSATVAAIDAASGPEAGRIAGHRILGIGFGAKGDRTGFGGGIAAADGKLYVSSGFRFVAQLDAATGAVGWTQMVDAPIHDAPNVAGGKVYAITIENQLLSFDTATGAPGWDYQALIEPARILAASSPAISGDTMVAAFGSGELVALRTGNGNELWNQALSRASRTNALSEIRDIPGRPVIYKGDVYAISHSGMMTTTDLRTGEPRWTLPVVGITTPLPVGDVVYIVSKAGEVICASRDNGLVYWIRELNGGAGLSKRKAKALAKHPLLWSSPVLADNRLIMMSSGGQAIALNPKTGATLKTLKIGAAGLIAPIAVRGKVYAVTDDATLVAFR